MEKEKVDLTEKEEYSLMFLVASDLSERTFIVEDSAEDYFLTTGQG